MATAANFAKMNYIINIVFTNHGKEGTENYAIHISIITSRNTIFLYYNLVFSKDFSYEVKRFSLI